MAKQERPEKWPKNAIGNKLQMFDSTVVLVRSCDEWNQAVSYLLGKPINALEPKQIAHPEKYSGLQNYYTKSDRKGTIFLVGIFDGKRRTLLHELDHAVFDICSYYGIPARDGEANEFHCYLLEYLFSEFEPFLSKNATPTA